MDTAAMGMHDGTVMGMPSTVTMVMSVVVMVVMVIMSVVMVSVGVGHNEVTPELTDRRCLRKRAKRRSCP